ncbi:MAG: TonB-dependent receptor [Acidobacteriota bacterium]
MMSARASAAVLLASLFLTAVAAAQVPSPTGNLYGTVLDEQGSSLPAVSVTLAGPGAPLSTTTDRKGDFHFLNLSPGAYSVKLERKEFEKARRDVTVLLGKNAVLSVTLPVAGAAESVTVSSEGPLVDSRKTGTGATFGSKELQTIPTTRDPWAILRQVPGVLIANVNVGGSGSGAQSGFVGKGSHSDQNTYNLDGVGVTESNGQTSVYFDFDSLDSIGVVTGGSDPSLTTSGVTLNLVTKRGTNQLLGSARALYAESAGWDYGVEAGGPLWKNRLWLWGAFAQGTFLGQTAVLPGGEQTQSKPTIDLWNAKLTSQLAASNSLVFSYANSNKHDPGQFAAPDRSQPTTYDEVFTTSAYRLEDSHVISANLFSALSFSYLSDNITQTPQGGLDSQALFDKDFVWRNSFEFHSARRPRYQAGLTASGFFDTGNLRHELKFGFGYKNAPTDSLSSWPGDGLVGFEPFGLASITRNAHIKWLAKSYDAFLGDTIQAGNLTITVGARFDYQQGKNRPSAVPANPVYPDLLPAVQYGGNSGYPVTWRQFLPRVGVTYSLGSSRKTLLRASYSEFANRLKDEVVALNAFPGAQGLYYYWTDANENHRVDKGELDLSRLVFAFGVDPNNPGSSVPVNQIAKDLKPPTTDELIVGVEREILSDLSAALAYTHRSARNPEFLLPDYFPLIGTSRDSYQYVGNASGTARASPENGGLVLNFNEPYYRLVTCPAPCAGGVLENRKDFTETYNGVELQVVKRLSHGWMLRASFAYNDWRQNVGPGAILNPNNMTGGTNASGPVVDGSVNSKWQFNISGLVQLPFGIGASANLFGRQGFPVLYNVQVITNDFNLFADPHIQIGAVGAYRLPAVYLLDLHVQKLFRIGTAVTISPVLDCFNVANSHTVLRREGFVGSYDATQEQAFNPNRGFNAPGELLSKRVFRGGARIAF